MAIRNNKLGGSDFVNGEVLYDYDLDDTNNALIDIAAKGVAQNAYQTLKHAGTFDNKDNLGADRFADADGVNNTVNTGSSSANYGSSNGVYILEINTGGTTETSDSVPFNYDNVDSIQTSISISGTGIFTNVTFGNDSNNFNYVVNIKKNGTIIAAKSGLTVNGINSVDFVLNDYSDVLVAGDTCVIEVDADTTIYRNSQSYSGTLFSYSSERVPTGETTSLQPFTFTDASFEGPRKLVCDTNTLTLDGTEKNICIYTDATQTANTSITVDISDGTTTINDLEFNTVNEITSLGSGQLAITFNLSTTDTSETPKLYGYSYYIN